MRNLSLVKGSTTRRLPMGWSERGSARNGGRNVEGGSIHQFPSRFVSEMAWSEKGWSDAGLLYRNGEFFSKITDQALFDFISISERFVCPGQAILLTEGQESASVLLLLEGKVKLSLNSSDGRRLIVGFASPGEILGWPRQFQAIPTKSRRKRNSRA